MNIGDEYALVDFGAGRKLESFAGYLVDRPSPAAAAASRRLPDRWNGADACFDEISKRWWYVRPWPESLSIDCGRFRMPIRPTPFGHVGLFPEQAPNWDWLSAGRPPSPDRLHDGEQDEGAPRALNLFAYTGAATMALVAAGYQVAHVDAARPNVHAARVAAELNGWAARPIRFLVDDAAKFAARELRRRRRYHTIVLDPPAYGHSPRGKAWRLQRDLWPLLDNCLRLLGPTTFRLLITGHSPAVGPSEIIHFVQWFMEKESGPAGRSSLRTDSGRSQLKDQGDRPLDAGFFVRVWSE